MGINCEIDLNRCRSNPCLNRGKCVSGNNGFACNCAGTGYGGILCDIVDPTNYACPLGSEKLHPDDNCVDCQPGSFGVAIGLGKCIACQKGTYSNETAAKSPKVCQPCSQGSYSDNTHSVTCSSCEGNGGCLEVAGSFSSTGFPSPVPASNFSMRILDSDGKVILNITEESVVGYYYLGIYLGLVLMSGSVAIVQRKRLRRFVAPVAVILKTPFSYMQVILSSGRVTEIPSFFRGLVGIWVILGLVFVTLYQIHIFATQRITEVSALQPGTVFKDGSETAAATSSGFQLSVVIHLTPITCDSNDFIFSLSVTNILSRGTVTFPLECSYLSSGFSIGLASTSSDQLRFTPNSAMIVQVTSRDGTYLFNHGVSYELIMDSFDNRVVVMNETLIPKNSSLIGGNVGVDVTLTPTELVTDLETLSHGYSYSHFSSEIDELSSPESEAFKLSIGLQVPKSTYFQVKKTEVISGFDFVVGLLALASGVITGGSLVANLLSNLRRTWKRHRKGKSSGESAGKGRSSGLLEEWEEIRGEEEEELSGSGSGSGFGSGGKKSSRPLSSSFASKSKNPQLEVPLLESVEV